MRRGATYTRISRDPTGEGAGVARQEEDCRSLAASNGVGVVASFSDNDTSAYSGSPRPGYRALLAAIEAGEVDVVLVWHTDRLYRRTKDLEEYISVCQPRNVPTLAVQAGPLDLATPSGRMVARQLAAVGQYESEQKAERQARANLQRAKQGRHFSTLRVFGYETDGLTLRANEAEAVRRAYRSILDGVALAAICRRWNLDGLRTSKKGNEWDSSVLQQLLRSPRYAGYRVYKGEILVGDDGEPVRGEWPAIVDAETWHAAQAVLKDPSRKWPHPARQLLSGVALCGTCGAVMQSGGSRNGRRRYRCSAMGGHAYREADPIDAFVTTVVLQYLARHDIREALAPEDRQGSIAELRLQLAELQVLSDRLVDSFADGDLTQQQLHRGQARVAKRRQELEERLPRHANSLVQKLTASPDPAELWSALDVDERRGVIDDLLVIRIMASRTKEATYFDWRRRILNPASVELLWKHSPGAVSGSGTAVPEVGGSSVEDASGSVR